MYQDREIGFYLINTTGRERERGREGRGRSEAEEEIKRAFFVAMILSNQGKIT